MQKIQGSIEFIDERNEENEADEDPNTRLPVAPMIRFDSFYQFFE